MKVSVVIGSFNQKDKLIEVLLGFQEQNFPIKDYEVIIIDSSSTDGTKEKILSGHFKFNLIFEVIENKGKSYARNYGIKKALGKVIILTDADIIADKDFIKKHLEAHENSGYSMCFEGLEYNMKDTKKPINKSNIVPYIRKNIRNYQKLDWYYFISGNLSAPANILKENLFSEDFLGYGWEDIELGYRLFKKEIQLKYIKSAINYHYHSYNFREELEKKERMGFEASIFIKKHPELKNWLGFHPLLMIIYRIIHKNKKFIKFIKYLSDKNIVGRLARFVLCEYKYRYGYELGIYNKDNNIIESENIIYDVSVIIPTYEQKAILEKCLNSIYEFSKDINFEIIVVDNHSQDGTVFLIKEKFPKLNYIFLNENHGFAKSINIGIKQSKGHYLLLLNNDCILNNNILKNLFIYMEENRHISACGPKVLDENLKFQDQGSLFFNIRLKKAKQPIKVNYLPMAAFFVRREVFKNVGLLDENFFFYNEDLDYAKRMKKKGLNIEYLPQYSLIHLGKKSVNKLTDKVIFESYKGGLYYVKKHFNKFVYVIFKYLVLMEISIKIVLYLLIKDKREEIKGLKNVYRLVFNKKIL